MRVLDLYCGLGGVAAALGTGRGGVVGADLCVRPGADGEGGHIGPPLPPDEDGEGGHIGPPLPPDEDGEGGHIGPPLPPDEDGEGGHIGPPLPPDEDGPPQPEIVAAVDQSEPALSVYRYNFPNHPVFAKRVDSLDPAWLKSLDADLWWASPPCQPFTRRGKRRDLDDPRAQTLLSLLRHLGVVRPRAFAMENVEGFRSSDGHDLLHETLERAGYVSVREHLLCPSDFGVPNRRPRFYLVASRDELTDESYEPGSQPTLPELLDEGPHEDLWIDDDIAKKYQHAMHVVEEDDPQAVTNCFTSAYGRSHVRSGSYLRTRDLRVRRFSPAEILRLLGFPKSFRLPPTLRRQNVWRLVGNSLSLVPVRWVLSSLPDQNKLD